MILTDVVSLGVALMIPMLWAAYGETLMEKAGVLNVGIEGVMLIGAFSAALGVSTAGSIYVGLGFAIGAGVLCGIVLALLYVRLGTDQIVTGIMFNIFAFGLTTTLAVEFVRATEVTSFPRFEIPGLAEIPFFGEVLFDHNILVYAAFLAAPLVFYVLHRTWYGLYARACSEYPRAAEAAGLDVWHLRYIAVIGGCVLTSIGGVALFASSGGFVSGLTDGRGFIALAIVILARWNPYWIVGASLLFGVSEALQFQADRLGPLGDVPPDILVMIPYIVTILAVVLARASRYPPAVGVPYRPSAKAS
ncbi:MAG: ABC transporter permease [Solirubrobacterales bacterium]|nr:ABC transporter permease [Solirubrobacterales bacterium]